MMRLFSPPPVSSAQRSHRSLPGGPDLPGIPEELRRALAAAKLPVGKPSGVRGKASAAVPGPHADTWRGLLDLDLDLVVEAASLGACRTFLQTGSPSLRLPLLFRGNL